MTPIPTLADTLDALHVATGSDSRTAKALALTRQDIYLARQRNRLSDRAIVLASGVLGVPPGFLLASLHAEMTDDATIADAWRALAELAAPSALPWYYVKSQAAQSDREPQCEIAKHKPISRKTVHHIALSEENRTALRVLQWCLCVAKIAPDSPRLAYYVSRWNVPGKIEAAIASGSFADAIADCPAIDLCHLPAALAAIEESDRYNKRATPPSIFVDPEKPRLHA